MLVSPELALVDPELAAEARRLLPAVALWEPRRERPVAVPLPAVTRPRRAPAARPLRRLARTAPVVLGAFGLGAAIALLAGRGDHRAATPLEQPVKTVTVHAAPATTPTRRPRRHAPAVVTKEPAKPAPATKTKTTPAKQKPKPSTTTPTPPGTTTARKPAPQVKATKPAKPKQPAPPAAGRLLRWHAPAAPYYDLVLWRDGHRVYDAWPTTTSFRIPRTWTYGGRSHRLEPGTYLWFVYPGIGPRSRARYGPLAASGTFTVR